MKILAKDNEGEITEWEIVPDEALWQDGKLIFAKMFSGKWKLIREVEK